MLWEREKCDFDKIQPQKRNSTKANLNNFMDFGLIKFFWTMKEKNFEHFVSGKNQKMTLSALFCLKSNGCFTINTGLQCREKDLIICIIAHSFQAYIS